MTQVLIMLARVSTGAVFHRFHELPAYSRTAGDPSISVGARKFVEVRFVSERLFIMTKSLALSKMVSGVV